jgi:hypothetical protein
VTDAEKAEKRRIILRAIEKKEDAKTTNPSLINAIDAEIARLRKELEALQ